MNINQTAYEDIMLHILRDIYTDHSIASQIGLKGGAACRQFYGLDRFVMNIDFDFLAIPKKDYFLGRLEQIIKRYGKIKEAYKKVYHSFFVLSFEEKSQNIKIEINHQNFGSHYGVKKQGDVEILVMTQEDIFAHKLADLYEKNGEINSDIYDLWFFLQNRWSINKNRAEYITTLPWEDLLISCIEILTKKSDRHLLAGMGRLLNEEQKGWVKAKLRTETISLLKAMLVV